MENVPSTDRPVDLQWPGHLSHSSYNDLKAWLEMQMRVWAVRPNCHAQAGRSADTALSE